MAIERISIEPFLQGAAQSLVIDVRSPGEYKHGHIPGAVNIPLFADDERAIVGTAYKQQSREQAIKEGLHFFGPKMKMMVEVVEKAMAGHCPQSTTNSVYIYCWRGGMRSGAIAWLLDLYGFPVLVLAGGYKAYRRHVLELMAQPFSFSVLGGYTGSGKTEILQQLKAEGYRVIDLENLASHKGSAFGKIGMPTQPTQEMFENLLFGQLKDVNIKVSHSASSAPCKESAEIWIEDESQRIGQINIPGALWATMRRSPLYFLNIPFDERLEHISEEYGTCDQEELANCINRIAKRLGGLETRNALQFLSEGKIMDCFRILLHYYDKQYTKGLHTRPHLASRILTINAAEVSPLNANLLLSSPVTI